MSVSDYIKLLSEESPTCRGELIDECLNYYGLYGTRELTVEQAASFWKRYKDTSEGINHG